MAKVNLSESEFCELVKIVKDISGIDLTEKRGILETKLSSFLEENSLQNVKEFLTRLVYDKGLKQKALDFLTVNETYFYRELQQLKEGIFYIKSLDRPTSILSVPCSSGEEVYSLAILAALNSVKETHITGIDISKSMIEMCKSAKYKGRTLQRLGESEKRRFFISESDTHTVKKECLCHCRFELCNVFDEKFLKLGKFDLVFSRNMMIYFDYETRLKLMEIFYKITSKDARLYTGNSDLVPETNYFTKVFMPRSGTYYLRNTL